VTYDSQLECVCCQLRILSLEPVGWRFFVLVGRWEVLRQRTLQKPGPIARWNRSTNILVCNLFVEGVSVNGKSEPDGSLF